MKAREYKEEQVWKKVKEIHALQIELDQPFAIAWGQKNKTPGEGVYSSGYKQNKSVKKVLKKLIKEF